MNSIRFEYGKPRCREIIPLPGHKDTARAYTYCMKEIAHEGQHSPHQEPKNANDSRPVK